MRLWTLRRSSKKVCHQPLTSVYPIMQCAVQFSTREPLLPGTGPYGTDHTRRALFCCCSKVMICDHHPLTMSRMRKLEALLLS